MKRAAGILLFAGSATLLLMVLIRTYDRLPGEVFRVRWGYATAAILVIATANTGSALVWTYVLRGQGVRLPLAPSIRILSLSQLGKYLPGGVWQPLGWLEFGRRSGVPRGAGSVSILIVMTLTLVGALVVGPLLLAVDGTAGPFLSLLLLVPVALAALHPRALDRLLAFAARATRRSIDVPSLSFRRVVGGLAITVPMWLAYGLGLILTARSLNLVVAEPAALLSGAFAVAWAVGFLALPVPSGLAVREAVLMLLLRAGGIDAAEAAALAVASRLYFIVAEGGMALAALMIPKSSAGTVEPGSRQRLSRP
jgi:uncharacterized membrane protein YbhN (UPF0104 family)